MKNKKTIKILNKNKKTIEVFKTSNKGSSFLNKKIISNDQIEEIPIYDAEAKKNESFSEILKRMHQPIIFKEASLPSIAYISSMYLTTILSLATFFQLDYESRDYGFNDDCKFNVKNESRKWNNVFIQTLVLGAGSPLFILPTFYLFKKSLDEVRSQKQMAVSTNNTDNESTNTMKNEKNKLFRSSIVNLAGNLLIPIVFYAKIRPNYINLIDSYKNDNCWETVNQDSLDGTEITLTILSVIVTLFPIEVLYLYRVLHQKVDEFKEMVNSNLTIPLLNNDERENQSETEMIEFNRV